MKTNRFGVKKLLAVLLAAQLTCSMIPAAAYASDGTGDPAVEQNAPAAQDAPVMDAGELSDSQEPAAEIPTADVPAESQGGYVDVVVDPAPVQETQDAGSAESMETPASDQDNTPGTGSEDTGTQNNSPVPGSDNPQNTSAVGTEGAGNAGSQDSAGLKEDFLKDDNNNKKDETTENKEDDKKDL